MNIDSKTDDDYLLLLTNQNAGDKQRIAAEKMDMKMWNCFCLFMIITKSYFIIFFLFRDSFYILFL